MTDSKDKPKLIETPVPLILDKSENKALTLQIPEKSILVKVDSGVQDWVSPTIQIVVAILAAFASVGTILWQMKKQREHTLEQQKQITKSQLRLEAYRDFQKIYAPFLESSLIEIEIRLIFIAFQRQLDNAQLGFPDTPVQYREPNFREKLEGHLNNAIELTFYIERHAPLLPKFDVFTKAFSVAHYEIQKDRRKLQEVLLRWLPIDNPDFTKYLGASQFINNPKLSVEAVKEFEAVMEPTLDSLGLLKIWAMDLTVELQNHLLGDYADCKVSHREPIDSKFFVVSIDKYNNLMKYFDEQTEQGQNIKQMQRGIKQEQSQR